MASLRSSSVSSTTSIYMLVQLHETIRIYKRKVHCKVTFWHVSNNGPVNITSDNEAV